MSGIDLREVSLSYGTVEALRKVSLMVKPGEIMGYLGHNGAGKTTTLKILAGLLKPSSGDALVGGFSVLTAPLEAKAQIGFIPESGALYEKFSPHEYLTLVGRLYAVSDAEIESRAREWLHVFGMEGSRNQPIGSLSKGNKQKVCWISAILHEPRVLVLDEPLNGLDVESISIVLGLMRDFASSGRTVLYSSHLVDLIERVCTRVAIIHRGRLVGTGTIEEVAVQLQANSLEEALLGLGRV